MTSTTRHAARQVIRELFPDDLERLSGIDANPGLLLQRYVKDSVVKGKDEAVKLKSDMLNWVGKCSGNENNLALYTLAFERWKKSIPSPKATSSAPSPIKFELALETRLALGLGGATSVDSGICLHHTYGTPYIPGSAVKGLAAHYCNEVLGEKDLEFKTGGKYHRLIFGECESRGTILFHDAWYVPNNKCPLVKDILTPHHSGWNSETNPIPPTDFDTPVPNPFLVSRGSFLFVVEWKGPESVEAGKWLSLISKILLESLFEWGVGGKTSSGYGKFSRESYNAYLEKQLKEKEREAAELRERLEKEEREKKLESLSPIDRKIELVMDKNPNKTINDKVVLLVQELQSPKCVFESQEEKLEVAEKVKSMMCEEGRWKDNYRAKEKDAKRKQFIEDLLKQG